MHLETTLVIVPLILDFDLYRQIPKEKLLFYAIKVTLNNPSPRNIYIYIYFFFRKLLLLHIPGYFKKSFLYFFFLDPHTEEKEKV